MPHPILPVRQTKFCRFVPCQPEVSLLCARRINPKPLASLCCRIKVLLSAHPNLPSRESFAESHPPSEWGSESELQSLVRYLWMVAYNVLSPKSLNELGHCSAFAFPNSFLVR